MVKNKDTLYTENGLYNTVTEQAYFGKNLYKQGTKSLKGDSLFYDRLKGYGRAVKNVLFDDKEQKDNPARAIGYLLPKPRANRGNAKPLGNHYNRGEGYY